MQRLLLLLSTTVFGRSNCTRNVFIGDWFVAGRAEELRKCNLQRCDNCCTDCRANQISPDGFLWSVRVSRLKNLDGQEPDERSRKQPSPPQDQSSDTRSG